jgi:hypothetical protein
MHDRIPVFDTSTPVSSTDPASASNASPGTFVPIPHDFTRRPLLEQDFLLGPLIVNWHCPTVLNSAIAQDGSVVARNALTRLDERDAARRWLALYPQTYRIERHNGNMRVVEL